MSLRTLRIIAVACVALAAYNFIVAAQKDYLVECAVMACVMGAIVTGWFKLERLASHTGLMRRLQKAVDQIAQGRPHVTVPFEAEGIVLGITVYDQRYAVLVAREENSFYSRTPRHCQAMMYFFKDGATFCAYYTCAVRTDEDINQILVNATAAHDLHVLPRPQLVTLIGDMERWMKS